MYRLFNCFILAVFYALLFGCDGGPASNYPQQSAGTSSSPATAKMPSSLPAGTRISFNPEITLNVEVSAGSSGQATYTNNSGSSDFGIGEEEILVHLKLTPASLIITYTLKNNEQVELVLTNFIDMGDDGYFDEFNVKVTLDGKDLGEFVGRFSGNQKPKNSSKNNIQELKTAAPTEKQFQDLLTEKAFLTVDNDGPSDVRIVSMKRSGEFIISYSSPNPYPQYSYKYKYEYNGGNPRFTVNIYQNDTGNLAQIIIKLKFTNFYEGTYEWIEIWENEKQSSADETGTFVYYSEVDAALKAINN